MPSLIWFEWEKCPDGYSVEVLKPDYVRKVGNEELRYLAKEEAPKWVKDNIEDWMFLEGNYGFEIGDQFLIPKSQNIMKFQPIDGSRSGLFLELSECSNSVSKLVEFVTKYGLLTRAGYDSHSKIDLAGLHVQDIQNVARKFSYYVEVWEEAKATDSFGNLTRLFNREYLPDDKYRDYSPYMTNGALNMRLNNHGQSASPPSFALVPDSLFSALWLQFAQAVTINLQLRRCVTCPTWFAFGTGTNRRKSAHYCSDKCRKAAHRRQKAEDNNG